MNLSSFILTHAFQWLDFPSYLWGAIHSSLRSVIKTTLFILLHFSLPDDTFSDLTRFIYAIITVGKGAL